tara:strand:+ start:223 stop:507 length:285 start_codon:yes stop_codon:yes gene_type:complete
MNNLVAGDLMTARIQELDIMMARIKELETELAELKTKTHQPWIPSIGKHCLVTFNGSKPEKCKVLALHRGQAWIVGTGKQAMTVDAARLTQAKE